MSTWLVWRALVGRVLRFEFPACVRPSLGGISVSVFAHAEVDDGFSFLRALDGSPAPRLEAHRCLGCGG